MKRLFIFLLIISGCLIFGQENTRKKNIHDKLPVHQLRIYEIPKENRQVFLDGSGIMHSGSWKNTVFILSAYGNRNSMKKQNLSTCLNGKMKIQ